MGTAKYGNIPETLDQKRMLDIMELACSQAESGRIDTREMVDVLAACIKGNGSFQKEGKSFLYMNGK